MASITPTMMVNTISSALRRGRDIIGDLARAVPSETACIDAACSTQDARSLSLSTQFCSNVGISHAGVSTRPVSPPAIERAAPQQLARGTDFARRLARGVRMAWGHESRDHVELARTRVPAVPSRPRGVVVPRLERATTAAADTVRGTPVRRSTLHTAAAIAGPTALLLLLLGAADAAGPASMTARALVVSDQARGKRA